MQSAYNMISDPCQLETKMPRAATPLLCCGCCVSSRTSSSLRTSFVETFCPRVPGPATVSYQAPPGLKPERSDKEILRTAQLQIQCHFQHKSTTTISQFMLCTGSLLQKYTNWHQQCYTLGTFVVQICSRKLCCILSSNGLLHNWTPGAGVHTSGQTHSIQLNSKVVCLLYV